MNKKFDHLIVATNAKSYSRRVIKNAATYGVELVTLKEIDHLLKKTMVTRKQIQRRLMGKRLAI